MRRLPHGLHWRSEELCLWAQKLLSHWEWFILIQGRGMMIVRGDSTTPKDRKREKHYALDWKRGGGSQSQRLEEGESPSQRMAEGERGKHSPEDFKREEHYKTLSWRLEDGESIAAAALSDCCGANVNFSCMWWCSFWWIFKIVSRPATFKKEKEWDKRKRKRSHGKWIRISSSLVQHVGEVKINPKCIFSLKCTLILHLFKKKIQVYWFLCDWVCKTHHHGI